MASAQTILDLWQACEKHRISFREIGDLFSKRFLVGRIASVDDAKIAEMIAHIQQVEKARHELLAATPMPVRQPTQAEVVDDAIEDESDRDFDDDQTELETDADRYPTPRDDEADAFDVHDNTIGYDQPDEEEESFPEPDDIEPAAPTHVRQQPAPSVPVETKRPEPSVPVTPAGQRTPASQSVASMPPSARLPRRRPPVASPSASALAASPAKSDERPAQSQQSPKGLKPRTGMGFVPTTPAAYADLSPEAIKNATWDKPVPMSMEMKEALDRLPADDPPEELALKPIRRPAWLGTIATLAHEEPASQSQPTEPEPRPIRRPSWLPLPPAED